MVNPVHFEKLCQGPAAWNEWRQSDPDVTPDLSGASLSLNQRQFGPSNGGPINLRGVNLEGTMLRFATLTGADLEGACLAGTDLMHARIDRADLTGADLTDALLDNTDLTNSRLDGAVLVGASFRNARNLFQHQIQSAYGDASTMLPLGLVPPQEWFPATEAEPEEIEEFPRYPAPEQVEEESPFDLLGVEPSAQPEEVRSAYRKLVKQLHPDLNPGDAEAELQFRKVNDAYRSLKIKEELATQDQQRTSKSRRYEVAALFGVFLLLSSGVYYWLERSSPASQPHQAATIREEAPAKAAVQVNVLPEQPGKAEAARNDAVVEASGLQVAIPAKPDPGLAEARVPTSADIKSVPAGEKPLPRIESQPQTAHQDATSIAKEPQPVLKTEDREAAANPNGEKASGEHLAVMETPFRGEELAAPHAEQPVAPGKQEPPSAANGAPQSSASGQALPVGSERVGPVLPNIATPVEPAQQEAAPAEHKAEPKAPVEAKPVETKPVKVAALEEEWQALRGSNDLAALYGYIKQHPDVEEARTRFQTVIAELTDSATLADFVKNNEGEGEDDAEVELAKQRLAVLTFVEALEVEQGVWNAALKKGTRDAFDAYLRVYGNGPHATEAIEKIAALREAYRKRDEAAWSKARKEDTREAYAAYLAANPHGYFVKEAQKQLREPAKKHHTSGATNGSFPRGGGN